MKASRTTTFAWLGIGLLAALGVLGLNLGAPDSWRELGVPVIEPRWTDTRIITAGAECDERGLDPLVENPCDHDARTLNYPRVWVTIANAMNRSVVALATIFSLVYLIGGLPRSVCCRSVSSPSSCLRSRSSGRRRSSPSNAAITISSSSGWSPSELVWLRSGSPRAS